MVDSGLRYGCRAKTLPVRKNNVSPRRSQRRKMRVALRWLSLPDDCCHAATTMHSREEGVAHWRGSMTPSGSPADKISAVTASVLHICCAQIGPPHEATSATFATGVAASSPGHTENRQPGLNNLEVDLWPGRVADH